MSRNLKVSSSAIAKTIKRNDETGSREDCHGKLRHIITAAAEDNSLELKATSDCNPNKCFTEFK